MNNRGQSAEQAAQIDVIKQSANPFAGSSLVPMLVIGIVLTLAGMIVAVALS
jgi:hypothetical protein